MARNKATLYTVPVAWHGEIPTKYQSFLEYPTSKEEDARKIRILSSPMSSREEAIDDLRNELSLWQEAVLSFRELL